MFTINKFSQFSVLKWYNVGVVMQEEKRIKSKVGHENIILLLSRNKEANRWIEGECRK